MIDDISTSKQIKSISVPILSWQKWRLASRAMDVSLITFIITVCDYAAEQCLEKAKKTMVDVEGEDLVG